MLHTLVNHQKKETASKKTTRIIELGWMYASDTEEFRQVRKLSGGGTRQIQVEQSAKVSLLREKAIELFFPGGISPKGKISDFASVLLVDFKLNALDETLTVKQYFELTALTKLRFYLATRNLNEESSEISALQPKRGKRKRNKFQFSSEEDDRSDYGASAACQELLLHQDNRDSCNMPSVSYEGMGSETLTSTTSLGTEVREETFALGDSGPDELTVLVNSILDDTYNNEPNIEESLPNIEENLATFLTPDVQSLEQILTNLQNRISSVNITKINVYRKDIFGCCLRAFRRKNFKPFNIIYVNFTDIEEKTEGAIDEGGPKREMFRLLLKFLSNSNLFTGNEMKHISLDSKALHEQYYYEAGRIISLSLVHGGTGPHFFSETLYSLVTYGIENTTLRCEDLEPDIKEKVDLFQSETDLFKLRDMILSDSIFPTAGCHFIEKLDDKERILQDQAYASALLNHSRACFNQPTQTLAHSPKEEAKKIALTTPKTSIGNSVNLNKLKNMNSIHIQKSPVKLNVQNESLSLPSTSTEPSTSTTTEVERSSERSVWTRDDHNVTPVAIVSSFTNNFPAEENCEKNEENDDENIPGKKKRKLLVNKEKPVIKILSERETNAERRHQENLQKKNEALDLCRQILDLAQNIVEPKK
ncbi:unnamed protein product [Ceutorhynchus assimilis]|uniref:G2/M phase-specific E3 ubiquitin-protein ligase n=1 Tax=Ceutorhynchus assimilis TaxID=467358 RepID=A0A9N9MLU9_9CUCU|nr:unnamed protein product [Ceutorhynchus assimilis]